MWGAHDAGGAVRSETPLTAGGLRPPRSVAGQQRIQAAARLPRASADGTETEDPLGTARCPVRGRVAPTLAQISVLPLPLYRAWCDGAVRVEQRRRTRVFGVASSR